MTLRELIAKHSADPESADDLIFEVATEWGNIRAAYEREACAKIADDEALRAYQADGEDWRCREIATAIRARNTSQG